jgi:Flp pilus assembly protein TadG
LRRYAGRTVNKRVVFNEQGQALVEMALAAVLFFAMLFGVIWSGLMLYTYHYISYVAHATTRYAAVRGSSCTGCSATASQIANYAAGLQFPGVVIAPAEVTVTWSGNNTPANAPGNYVIVTISHAFSSPFKFPLMPATSPTMTSTSRMVISQ